MKRMKGLFHLLFFVLVVVTPAISEKIIPITVIKDGAVLKETNLVLIEKMGYLKARDVSEIFSVKVDFDLANQELLLTFPDATVQFTVNSNQVVIDGIKRKMRKKTLIIDGRVHIPLEAIITRAFQSASGANIRWSFTERKLWISYLGNIRDIRYYSYDNYTRVVIEMTDAAFDDKKSVIKMTDKQENDFIKLILNGGKLTMPFRDINVQDGVIKNIRTSEFFDRTEFSIFTSQYAGEYNIIKLPGPPRIVIDIKNKKIREPARIIPLQTVTPRREESEIRDINLIVIDAGHGGRDPGAVGQRGTLEKDIVLDISKRLAKRIRERLDIEVVLTRSGDYFLPLSRRTQIANNEGADLFISIHANAAFNRDARGFEVFFLSDKASDKEAQAVANRENSVIAMEERTAEIEQLTRILWSLTMNKFMNESSILCAFINSSVIEKTDLLNRGVKQANFHVLRGARMPAALVEIGFISNKQEERLLNSRRFKNRMAEAIMLGVKKYRDWLRNQ